MNLPNHEINIDIWYYISTFCDFPSQLNIKKLCQVTNNSYKITNSDPIYPLRKDFTVMYNDDIFGTDYVTNTHIDTVLKKIIQIRKKISKTYKIKGRITFDIVWNTGKEQNYSCIDINNNTKITVDNKSKFIYPHCLINNPQSFSIYNKNTNSFYGKYHGIPSTAGKKICTKLFRTEEGNTHIDFCIMRINDGKCFYYTGSKIDLIHPQQMNVHGKNIIFRSKSKIKSRKIKFTLVMS